MNVVTLYIKERNFLNCLLRNTIFSNSYKNIEDIPFTILKHALNRHGINYITSFESTDTDLIITDDISIAKDIFDKKIIFLPPIDYNVIDGFVNELKTLKGENLDMNFNPIDYLEANHPNLVFTTPSLIPHPNIIFDLSLILNYNLYDLKWGAIHYNSKDLFKTIVTKPYRIDFSIREVRKANRIKLFLELIDSGIKNNIKLTIHDLFLYRDDMRELAKQYFIQNDCEEYFEKIISLESKYYSGDSLESETFLYQEWPLNKLINHTLLSDISCFFESAPEGKAEITMDYLITEKTIDLLSIGKPFIYNNRIVKKFIQQFGFIDYTKFFPPKIASSSFNMVKYVSELNEVDYLLLLNNLNKAAQRNLKKLEEYRDKNTFLYNLIHN